MQLGLCAKKTSSQELSKRCKNLRHEFGDRGPLAPSEYAAVAGCHVDRDGREGVYRPAELHTQQLHRLGAEELS